MTRINIISPSELTDQHLVAEYREIFMVGSSLQRSLKSKNWESKNIPKKRDGISSQFLLYTLFFYNNLIYQAEIS